MSVPIHNLYDYIYQVLEKRYFLYHFYPFGQKKFNNIITYFESLNTDYVDNYKFLYKDIDQWHLPHEKYIDVLKIFPKELVDLSMLSKFSQTLLCHDQEPLDFDFYENFDLHQDYIEQQYKNHVQFHKKHTSNLRWKEPRGFRKKWILLHSEMNSNEVEKYQQNGKFECAYYWSHAILSRDWFRYAKYDTFLQPGSTIKKTFLIYCRATDGKRRYRQTFLKLLKNYNIQNYQLGSFNNKNITSDLSAEYDHTDINQTAISVVLETCFDHRIHLTEKTLRAIACGHPFLLASGPKSLQYLKKYGFQTFHPLINESYDNEFDSQKRLEKIVQEMQRIQSLPNDKQQDLFSKCKGIADHNKKIFFSDSFFDKITKELIDNVQSATLSLGDNFDVEYMWENRKFEKQDDPDAYKNNRRLYYLAFIKHLRKGGTLDDYVPPWEKS